MLQVIRRVSTNTCTATRKSLLLRNLVILLSESGLEAGTVCQSCRQVQCMAGGPMTYLPNKTIFKHIKTKIG